MPKIRVLVVDDSVVIRTMVSRALSSDPLLEVVGTAANGRIALSKVPQVNPDAITLDLEMPELNGLETLRELRRTHPRLPVIIFSTVSERGAAATLDALALGANDYVTKPSNVGSATAALQRIREQLIPKIKVHCLGGTAPGRGAPLELPIPAIRRKPRQDVRAAIVAIGVSTGGPNALAEVLPKLAADLAVPVLIVQHMPPLFTRLLAERLASKSKIRIAEGLGGEILRPGDAWVAPGDVHLTVKRCAAGVRLATHQGPPENSCRPAVDVLFRSVAEVYGAGALAVIMTGMGRDGLRGCEAIRDVGGCVVAQDQATSVVWGMPGAVAQAGLADRVLPLHEIAWEIMRRVTGRRRAVA